MAYWDYTNCGVLETNQYSRITRLRPSPFPNGEALISWVNNDIRFGIGTFAFVASATYRPIISASNLIGYKSVVISEINKTVTLNANQTASFYDYLDTWTAVNFKNVVLFDNNTGTPLVWWELDNIYNISRKYLQIYLSNFYIRFTGAIGSVEVGPLTINALKTHNKYGAG